MVWLSAGNTLLAATFLLGALILYTYEPLSKRAPCKKMLVIATLILLSLTAKEHALLFPLFAIGIDLLLKRKPLWKSYLLFIAVDVIYFVWRFKVLGKLGGYVSANQESLHTTLHGSSILAYAKLPLLYVHNFFNQLSTPSSLAFIAQTLIVILIITIGFFLYKEKKLTTKNTLFSLFILGSLFYLGNLLGWNLVNPHSPTTEHSRIAYISTIWFTLAMGFLFGIIRSPLAKGIFILYLLILPALTYYQIQPWIEAGKMTRSINTNVTNELNKFESDGSIKKVFITGLPDQYQGAFIYRNGIEYATDLSDIRKMFVDVYETMQPGTTEPITIRITTTTQNLIDL